jgi:hypothetical protein
MPLVKASQVPYSQRPQAVEDRSEDDRSISTEVFEFDFANPKTGQSSKTNIEG